MEIVNRVKRIDFPDGDYVAFIPAEDRWAIEHTIRNMEQVRQELSKIGDKDKSTGDTVDS